MEEMQDAAMVLLGIETWPRLPHASDSPTNDDITIAYLPHKSSSPNQFEQGSTSARCPCQDNGAQTRAQQDWKIDLRWVLEQKRLRILSMV